MQKLGFQWTCVFWAGMLNSVGKFVKAAVNLHDGIWHPVAAYLLIGHKIKLHWAAVHEGYQHAGLTYLKSKASLNYFCQIKTNLSPPKSQTTFPLWSKSNTL